MTIKVTGKNLLAEQVLAIELQKKGNAVEIITEGKGEAHFSPKGMGAFGDMLIITDDNPLVGKIAAALKVTDDWKLKKVGADLYAAYHSGDRLTFFTHTADFQGDDL